MASVALAVYEESKKVGGAEATKLGESSRAGAAHAASRCAPFQLSRVAMCSIVVVMRMLVILALVFISPFSLVAHAADNVAATQSRGLPPDVAVRIYGFTPSAFPFKVIVPDDGTTDPGGWQEAATQLLFRDARRGTEVNWTCSLKVGIPLRTAKDGVISMNRAARLSSRAANAASDLVMQSRPAWLPALFCPAFGAVMMKILHETGASGARVSSKHP